MKITRTEKYMLVAVVVCILCLAVTVPRITRDIEKAVQEYEEKQEATDEAAWSGWVKETGNPKGLTKEEWLALQKRK
jgi:cell division protein FtsL